MERAITKVKPDYTFVDIPQYVEANRVCKAVKIHGSTDWFIPFGSIGNWSEHILGLNVLGPWELDQVVIFKKVPVVKDYAPPRGSPAYGKMLYPLVTAPLAGKQDTEFVAPPTHIEVAKKFLNKCSKFLIIGTSGLDEDLFQLLDSSISSLQNLVHVVGKKHESTRTTLKHYFMAVPRMGSHTADSNPVAFDKGFDAYMDSPEFQSFLDHDTDG